MEPILTSLIKVREGGGERREGVRGEGEEEERGKGGRGRREGGEGKGRERGKGGRRGREGEVEGQGEGKEGKGRRVVGFKEVGRGRSGFVVMD